MSISQQQRGVSDWDSKRLADFRSDSTSGSRIIGSIAPELERLVDAKQLTLYLPKRDIVSSTAEYQELTRENATQCERSRCLRDILFATGRRSRPWVFLWNLYLALLVSHENDSGEGSHRHLAVNCLREQILRAQGIDRQEYDEKQKNLPTIFNKLGPVIVSGNDALALRQKLGLENQTASESTESVGQICEEWLQRSSSCSLVNLVKALLCVPGLGKLVSQLVPLCFCNTQQICTFVRCLHQQWPQLALYLGYSQEEIDAVVECCPPNDINCQIKMFLRLWWMPSCGRMTQAILDELKTCAGIITPSRDVGVQIYSPHKPKDGELNLEKYLTACEETMRKKGKLNQTIIPCVFVGPPGNGKTSLMRRLIGKSPLPSLPSTGVAEKVVQVYIRKSSSTAAQWSQINSVWNELTLDDEAIALLMDIFGDQTQESHSNTPSQPSPSASANASASTSDSGSASANTRTAAVAKAAVPPSIFKLPLDMFKDILRTKGLSAAHEYFEGACTAYLTDTGGQLEFQELLPALVSGPSVFFLVFRLDQDLNQIFTVEYRHPSKGCSIPYESSYTVTEFLLHTLASIASMGSYEDAQKKQVPLKPIVFFVGTHRDKVSKEKIEEIDRDLLQKLKHTDHYRSGIIQFASEKHLIIPVNNLSPDDSDAQLVRSAVERIRDQGTFDISAPPQWLIFSQVIRQRKERVLTYNECFTVAKQCGIDTSQELNDVLGFLSTKLGLFRYIQGTNVDKDLQKIVIQDPQVLFDGITNLIIATFTFKNVDPVVFEDFQKKGIFSRAMFEEISSKEGAKILTPSRFLKLLQHLHIIAPIQELSDDTRYFIPCILARAAMVNSKQSESSSQMTDVSEVPPLLACFCCGYCPRGLFCSLVVYLLNNKMKSRFPWKLDCEEIFRDQISFSVGPYDYVSLKVTPTFIEVNCSSSGPQIPRVIDFVTVCREVRRTIESGVQTVATTLHYKCDPADLLKFGFYCPYGHPAEIIFYGRIPCNLKCSGCQNHRHNFPVNYTVWFDKEHYISLVPGQYKKPGKETCGRKLPSAQVTFDSEVEPGSTSQTIPPGPSSGQLSVTTQATLGYAQLTSQQVPHYPYSEYAWPYGPPMSHSLPNYPCLQSSWTNPETGVTPFLPSSTVPTHLPVSPMKPVPPPVGDAGPYLYLPSPHPPHVSTGIEPAPLAGTNIPTLDQLLDNIRTTKWFRLGLKLGVKLDDLDVIECDRKLDSSGALMDVLRKWLKEDNPTWNGMVRAMREIGEVDKARRLECNFC